jgi:predicted RNase H-like nuclease (RuvC/YqgF family)
MEVEDRHLEQQKSLVEEAIVAELAETIELQARKLKSLDEEVESLRTERSSLADELHMARAWIRELAAELQRASAPQAG